MARGQVELVSTFYTPNAWIAYPGRDLRKSIVVNRARLDAMGLSAERIFFAHEAFFGEGVRSLEEFFDIALCKDDYLDYFYDIDFSQPIFQLGSMRVVVGSNHILNELRKRQEAGCGAVHMRSVHSRVLRSAASSTERQVFPASRGKAGEDEWIWYHLGSGHHFCVPTSPMDLSHFFLDHDWLRQSEDLIRSYQLDGYCFTTIRKFVERISAARQPELPVLVEGSLNSRESEGVFVWMGDQRNSWEDDATILTQVSRSRIRLSMYEDITDHCGGGSQISEYKTAIEDMWLKQLFAEASDSLGWHPAWVEVLFALARSEEVLSKAGRLLTEVSGELLSKSEVGGPSLPEDALFQGGPLNDLPVPEIFGGGERVDMIALRETCYLCEVDFSPTEPCFGIKMPLTLNELVYCPSGLERAPVSIPFQQLRPKVLYIPLANGLIGVAPNVFVIKDVRFLHLAARIDVVNRSLSFMVRAPSVPQRRYRWRFYIVQCSLDEAVRVANGLNYT